MWHRFGGWKTAPKQGPHEQINKKVRFKNRPTNRVHVLFKKALAVWQWFHFLRRQVPPNKPVLVLNLDETSIRFWYEPRRGLRPKDKDQGESTRAARQASRGQMRKAVTHVAIICNDHTIQPHLPQVIIVNEHIVSARTMRTWKPLAGTKAEVWRQKSAWINNENFGLIIKGIGKAVQARAPERQIILLMDAHICHFSKEALRQAALYQIWPCIIPASTTSFLQPLDTHVFSRFKMYLRTCMHKQMMSGANRDLSSEQVLQSLMESMKGVLQKHRWAEVFQQNGFGSQLQARPHLLKMLHWTEQPCIPNEMPTLEQFQSCFPQGREIPFRELFQAVVRGPKSLPRTTCARPKASVTVESHEPWSKRLRPRIHRFGDIAAKTLKRSCDEPTFKKKDESHAKNRKMTTTSGDPMPSLKPFPPRGRRSRIFP